ncbi:MAG: phosphoribosylformylglycinamidine synthase I [Methanosarcinaceae archaeon]|nr:phosphoribosylformylglycinamidine synthase I [Methanosarcinaceae archaeon]
MKIAIIQFGGSNCDLDVLHVLQDVVGVDAELVWYKEENLNQYDGAIIPGGFSYGDYLRAGAIAARTPIMDAVKKMASEGKPVMGICNGFQILAESGLLDGALTTNKYPKFRCESTYLKVENTDTPFTSRFKKGEIVSIPIAHMEGNFYADENTLARLNENEQVVFRYADINGNVTDDVNPNGSQENIAGIVNANAKRNVIGLMPHPERASEAILRSDDGIKMFQSMVDHISKK